MLTWAPSPRALQAVQLSHPRPQGWRVHLEGGSQHRQALSRYTVRTIKYRLDNIPTCALCWSGFSVFEFITFIPYGVAK